MLTFEAFYAPKSHTSLVQGLRHAIAGRDTFIIGPAAAGPLLLETDDPFKATYILLDSQTQFRPLRTAIKLKIEGSQTAIVVGPASDEIYTVKLGREKTQLDWSVSITGVIVKVNGCRPRHP